MFIAKNDEEQRSRIWRAVVLVSTALIILIAIFLLTKMFTSNPVEGNWKDENGRMDLSIHGSGSADVTLLDFQEQDKVEVPLAYSIDNRIELFCRHHYHFPNNTVKNKNYFQVQFDPDTVLLYWHETPPCQNNQR